MLLVYLEPLIVAQQELLLRWEQHVSYWPRSYTADTPYDYWLLFYEHKERYATQWMLQYGDRTRIIIDFQNSSSTEKKIVRKKI